MIAQLFSLQVRGRLYSLLSLPLTDTHAILAHIEDACDFRMPQSDTRLPLPMDWCFRRFQMTSTRRIRPACFRRTKLSLLPGWYCYTATAGRHLTPLRIILYVSWLRRDGIDDWFPHFLIRAASLITLRQQHFWVLAGAASRSMSPLMVVSLIDSVLSCRRWLKQFLVALSVSLTTSHVRRPHIPRKQDMHICIASKFHARYALFLRIKLRK